MTLRPLTALRFPAALAVFIWHAPLTKPWAQPLSLGYLGVGFFFILSGFILTYAYHGAHSVRAFYVARIARIVPVHVFGMALALIALGMLGGEHWSEIPVSDRIAGVAAQALLLQSWFPSPNIHFGINGPSWSLSDEAWFYLLFPVLGAALWRVFSRAGERQLLAAAAAAFAIILAAVSRVHVPFNQWAVYVLPLSRTGDFVVGMLLGAAYLRRPQANARDTTVFEWAALCALPIGVFVTAASPPAMHFYAAMIPFSAAAIYVFAIGGGAISRALSHAWLVWLGEASYAFYVIHFWIVRAIPNFAIALCVTVAASLLIYRYIETPLRRAIRRWGAGRTSAARPAPLPAGPAVSQTR